MIDEAIKKEVAFIIQSRNEVRGCINSLLKGDSQKDCAKEYLERQSVLTALERRLNTIKLQQYAEVNRLVETLSSYDAFATASKGSFSDFHKSQRPELIEQIKQFYVELQELLKDE